VGAQAELAETRTATAKPIATTSVRFADWDWFRINVSCVPRWPCPQWPSV
jgi:hypothetical protein